MTTVEKRRSSRKNGSHRKHNDGSYSDTETDREVSSLTDRAFRSLCIGDEAIYNDSDLSASPCIQRDRQLAISHNVQEKEDRDRQDLKRTAHESFSLRLQQYGQDWMYQGMYGSEIHKDQQWGVYAQRGSQGRLSATFQHSFVEAPQQEPPRELSHYSNGAMEVSSQQGRSRSRVSSLIRAFNSDGQQDETGYNADTSWDKSALMSIERELSEFSSYQQNMNTGYFPSAGLLSSQNTNYYSTEVAAMSQMNTASSFLRSSHSKHSMSTQGSCNSNFFIHSEFSPFKVWRDYNRFPFHRGQVSGFVPCSEFSSWYETPMYKELSLQPQQPSSMFQGQGMAYHRNTFAPAVPMNPQRSTSTSTMMQRASAVEKRCESELAGHYRKRAQSLGPNRLPSQRPSTASPSSEMSRRVRDTISSVKSLQQKIKMMSVQNIETQSQGVFYNNDYLTPYGHAAVMNTANNSAAPYNMMQGLPVYAPPRQQQVLEHHAGSPQPVEHAPVRAESRGATPDIKMSGYKSKAASLLYNLKDNRKRVKSTYSPNKYKGLETQENYKQESKDFIIDVPDFSESELLNPMVERSSRLEVGQYEYQTQSYSQEMLQNSQQHYLGQDPSEYYRAQMQGEAAHHPRFTGFTPDYYTNNQLANGQNPYENLSSFTPYKHSVSDKGEGNYVNRQNTATEMQRFSTVAQSADYVSKDNSKHLFNEAVSREFTGVDRCNQLKENKYDYNNVYSQDVWGQTNRQEKQKPGIIPVQNNQNKNTYPRTNAQENVLNYNYEPKSNLSENYGLRPHVMVNVLNQMPQHAPVHNDNSENTVYNTQHQSGTYRDIYAPPVSQEYNKENKMKENYAPHDNNKYYDQESKKQSTICSQEVMPIPTEDSDQRPEPVIKEYRIKSLESKETKQNQLDVKEQVFSMTNHIKNTQVPMQQNKTAVDRVNRNEERSNAKPQQHKKEMKQGPSENNNVIKVDAPQDQAIPTPEIQKKLLQAEMSKTDSQELQEVTDKPGHMMERPEPKEQLIVEHANTVELKEEPIKCELAQSSEQARIEQVKSEPSCKEKVETKVKELQEGAENVERQCSENEHEQGREADQAVTEQIVKNQADTKQERNNTEVEVTTTNNNKEQIIGVETELEKAKTEETTQDETKINAQSISINNNKPDKVEQAKTELAKAKAELAKIKEKMKGDQKVQKEEENVDKVNGNSNVCCKEQEAVVPTLSVDQNNSRAEDYEQIREKYDSNHATTHKKATSITANEEHQTQVADKDVSKTNLNPSTKKTSTSPSHKRTLGPTENKEKTVLYDDPTGSQYVYSESSKDFKLSAASNVTENVDKSTNHKKDENKLTDVPAEKVEKSDTTQKRDVTKHQAEKKLKSMDPNTGASKETSLKGLTHKERAQAKQEILTSKIKAHAEKEISAIKEGFATRDGFKMSTKPLTLGQNMSVRQKPPSQESAVNNVTPKVLSPPPPSITVTANSHPPESLQKQMMNKETATEKAVNTGLQQSDTSSIKSTEKKPVTSQLVGDGHSSGEKQIHNAKGVQLKSQDKSLKQDNVDKHAKTEKAVPENTEPSLQLVFGQNKTASEMQDDSLKIMGIKVTVRERNTEDLVSTKCLNTDKHNLSSNENQRNVNTFSEEVNKGDNQTRQNDIEREIMNRKKSSSVSTNEKISQLESTSLNDKPQSETQLPEYQAENVVPQRDTVQAKNIVQPEIQPLPNKQDIITEETKGYASKTSKVSQKTKATKGQEEIDLQSAKDMNKVISLEANTSDNENSHVQDLNIDSIAIRVVPAVTDHMVIAQEKTAFSGPVTEKETTNNKQNSSNSHQKSASANDDVQKVLSSVRKQAQLLKNSNQQNINNTTNENTGNNNSKTVSKTDDEPKKEPMEEGYFQVEKRNSESQKSNTNVGETPAACSKEKENLNSDKFSNQSPNYDGQGDKNTMEKSKKQTPESSTASMQDANIGTSKHEANSQNDFRGSGDGHFHHTRRQHTTKERQRGLQMLQENADTAKEDIRPKPKVPIPEISALADYARLKVIVSQDHEDHVQEMPPNKKEGFFPLIQSRQSRRPVFTVDSQESIVKEKSSQNKSDFSIKLSKEPKAVAFPITEKEHRRTGLFKLGDKEKNDAKENKDTEVQETQLSEVCVMEQTKAAEDKTKGNEEKTAEEKIKLMLEKSRATQAEEEKRAAQREEEQRAREREAIALQIRERRKKHDTERYTVNEIKSKVVEQQIYPELNTKNEERQQKQEPRSNGKEEKRDALQQQRIKSEQNEKQQGIAALTDEQTKRLILEQQRKEALIEEQKEKAAKEEEQQRQTVSMEEKNRVALQEQPRMRAQEEQQRKALLIEQQKKKVIMEEQQRQAVEYKRSLLQEQHKKATETEEQKRFLVEQRRAELEEQRRNAALEEQQRKMAEEEQKRKAAQEEQMRKAALIEEQKRREVLEEKRRKAALEEQQRKIAEEEQKRKVAQEEQLRKAALIEDQKKRAVLEEQRRKAALEEQQRKIAEEEQKRKAAQEEQMRKAALIEEQKKRAVLEEQQRKAALEEQQRKIAEEEQKRKAAQEEQLRKSALIEEQKKRAVLEEQRRKAAMEEQKQKAHVEEQQKIAAMKEEQRRIALEEQQRKAAQEEQQRKAAVIEEQKRRAAVEEKKQEKRAILEEQQRKAAMEEQKQKAAVEEQQKRAAMEEEQRRIALEEQQKKMADEKQKRKEALIDEQKKMAALEEQRRKAALEEQQRKAAVIQEQKRTATLQEEEQQKRATLEEQHRKMAEEEQKRKAALIEEQQKRTALEEKRRKAAMEEQKQMADVEEQQKTAALKEKQRRAALEEQQRKTAQEEQLKMAAVIEEQKRRAALEEEEKTKQKVAAEERKRKDALDKQRQARQEEEERQLAYIKEERIRRQIEEEREAQIEEEKNKQKIQQQRTSQQNSEAVRQTKNETNIRAKNLQPVRATETEEQKNVSDKTEDLQYYSLTSGEAKKRNNTNGCETTEDSSVFYRPHAPESPAPSLPRSSASSPAPEPKPSMFKVKDNTFRGSSFIKSIKPRFHKNFGEEVRISSPMDQDKSAEEQDITRSNAGTPIHPDQGGQNKTLKEPRTHGYSTPVPHQRPYSRRSLVLDEEDSRSIVSNMSEDVESFATSAADLADIRTLYDSERPESACSYSSDISRSFGKPPAVPPKSEKALRRAKRLATRRLKKELTKTEPDDPCETLLTEEPNSSAVSSPHFSPPVSLAHAPPAGSSMSLSHSEQSSHQRSFHASAHVTAPISLPIASSHTTAPVSSPSSHVNSFSTSAVPKTIPHIPSSPTLHHAPKPVTQYQVESGFPQSYPVTQKRVLQDIGSGQYYVVDVPVEVKTKTFFDPETGKYVQLNVRESSRNAPQRQPLQAYPQPQLKSQLQTKPQQQEPSPSGNALYPSYPKYPKSSQSAASSFGPLYHSPTTVTQDQQPVRASINQHYGGPETGYSPEKTPYMDTVNNSDKAQTAVFRTRGSQEALSEGDSRLANSRYGSRDIITMSELEDFMEVSDW